MSVGLSVSIGRHDTLSITDEIWLSAISYQLSAVWVGMSVGIGRDDTLSTSDEIWLSAISGVGGINPMTDYYGRNQNRKINSIFTSLYTNIELPFGFTYKFSYQPRISYLDDFIFDGPESTRGISLPQGFSSRANQKTYEWMVDNLLTWNKTFGVHNLDFTFLYNIEEFQSWYNIQSNQNFTPNANLGFHALQFGDNPSISNSDTRQTGDALMGRMNYALMDRYLFTASVRRDGYSAFGQEQPHAVFPA